MGTPTLQVLPLRPPSNLSPPNRTPWSPSSADTALTAPVAPKNPQSTQLHPQSSATLSHQGKVPPKHLALMGLSQEGTGPHELGEQW